MNTLKIANSLPWQLNYIWKIQKLQPCPLPYDPIWNFIVVYI